MNKDKCKKCGADIRKCYKVCEDCCEHEHVEVVPTGMTNLKDVNCLECGYSRDFD